MYRPDYKTNLVIVLYEMSLLGVLKFYIHKIDSSLRLLLLKSPMGPAPWTNVRTFHLGTYPSCANFSDLSKL